MAAMETAKEKEIQIERERERDSDALTRFYVPPPGCSGMHIVAVVRLILEDVTWLVNRKRPKAFKIKQ